MVWVVGASAGAVLLAALALLLAINRNGPAVLSAIDRLAGPSGAAELKATISTGDSPQQKLIVWGEADPADKNAAKPVLLFVHGGSWRSGDPGDYGFIARSFIPEGFVVVLAGYRLHPAAQFPAMLEDTARAIAWTQEEIATYGGDPSRLFVAGHSAGAYNVVMTALDSRWVEQATGASAAIAGVIGLSGPYDFFPFDSESTRNAFGNAPEPERTQPINFARANAPPTLLIHGLDDTLVKPRNSAELERRLKEQGARVRLVTRAGMNHNDPLIALAAPWRYSRTIREEILRFTENPAAVGEPSVSVQSEMR